MNDVILYVDDDASNLVVFEAALKTEFEIITALGMLYFRMKDLL